MPLPVLLVHGIFGDGAVFGAMQEALVCAGFARVLAIDLSPNDGRASIAELSLQVDAAADRLLRASGETHIDVVGFSMGALVTRHWIQRRDGKSRVRRFVSISGPHKGTVNAWFGPRHGIRDMRPNSALLRDLDADADPWGETEVHCFWTPFDLMIMPPTSSVMARVKSVQRFPVKMHRWMVTDERVLDAVTELLLSV